MERHRGTATVAAALAAMACTPTLDWRDVRPPGSALQWQMPCKPASHARRISLAGAAVEMSLYACSAGGSTFAVASADLGDPSRVTAALDELALAAQANVQARAPLESLLPAQVPGMTPNPRAQRMTLRGRLPDGRAVEETVLVFAYATRVFQASVVGERIDTAATQTFVESLKVRP